MKILLIILLLVGAKQNCSPQIITITDLGRKVKTVDEPAKIKTSVACVTDTIHLPNKSELSFPVVIDFNLFRSVSLPLEGKIFISSYFGSRYHPVLHRQSFHEGLDLKAYYQIVKTIADGRIEEEGNDSRAGNYIVIRHRNSIESVYCHLSKFLIKTGDIVKAGEDIAISGATGTVTAPHLHFGIKENGQFINPYPLLIALITISAEN